jgi:SAM-dependent methyltransferase
MRGFGIRTKIVQRWREFKDYYHGRFSGHYVEWRRRRVAAILQHYGPSFFPGKRVLEVGAGTGKIGVVFARLGAQVTAAEGRPENVRIMKRKHPELTPMVVDFEKEWPWTEPFDVIIHFGLLYHLERVEESLRTACQNCQHLILETAVSDSTDPYFISHLKENALHYDQALHGVGSRPSPAYVERILADCGMSFQRVEDGSIDTVHLRPNFPDHIYTWPVGTSGLSPEGWRKFWFAERREKAST